MVQLRILEILEEKNQTKYWLFKQMGMPSYSHFQKIIDNKTSSIKFDTLIKLSQILEVPVGELFKHTEQHEHFTEKSEARTRHH